MPNFQHIADEIGRRFEARARLLFRSSLFVKIVLVVGGSAVVGVATFASVPDGHPTVWNIAGIAGAVVAGLGGAFLAISEQDASRDLEAARQALAAAQEADSVLEEIVEYDDDILRALELYAAVSAMRGVIERSVTSGKSVQVDMITNLMNIARRSLLIALRFQMPEHWTLCVYKAESDANVGTVLRCVAQHRSEECNIAGTRKWPIGVGVAGVALARGSEVIVPDLAAPELGSFYNLGAMAKDVDRLRYRSIVAVPVLVGSNDRPWGMVVATSDDPGHFYIDEKPGVHTAEAVRALSGMVALAVAVADEETGSESTPDSRTSGKWAIQVGCD